MDRGENQFGGSQSISTASSCILSMFTPSYRARQTVDGVYTRRRGASSLSLSFPVDVYSIVTRSRLYMCGVNWPT